MSYVLNTSCALYSFRSSTEGRGCCSYLPGKSLDPKQEEGVAVHIYLGEVWILNRRKGLLFMFTWEKFGSWTGGRGCCSYFFLGEVWILNRRKGLLFMFTWEKFGSWTGGRGCWPSWAGTRPSSLSSIALEINFVKLNYFSKEMV